RRRMEENLLGRKSGRERIATVREEMQKTMENSVGIYRNRQSLEETAGKIRQLQERFGGIKLDDFSRTFNTELTSALELGCMLDVAETMVHSALKRTESHGAHKRREFSARA